MGNVISMDITSNNEESRGMVMDALDHLPHFSFNIPTDKVDDALLRDVYEPSTEGGMLEIVVRWDQPSGITRFSIVAVSEKVADAMRSFADTLVDRQEPLQRAEGSE